MEHIIHHIAPNKHLKTIVHQRVGFILWTTYFGSKLFKKIWVLPENKKQLRKSLL